MAQLLNGAPGFWQHADRDLFFLWLRHGQTVPAKNNTVNAKCTQKVLTPRGESGTREGEVMRMDLTKVGKLPTIEQRLASAEKELGYLSEFLVKVLSDKREDSSMQALENQFTEGLKLVVRIRALRDAQNAGK